MSAGWVPEEGQGNGYAKGCTFFVAQAECFGSMGRPSFFHASQPPTRARALGQPAVRSSRATRALVASSCQAQ